MKHTQGKWTVVDVPSGSLEVQMDNGTPVCHMRWSDGMNKKREEIIMADATLIAAAPELLDSLMSMMFIVKSPDSYTKAMKDEAYDKALALLKKAKGES